MERAVVRGLWNGLSQKELAGELGVSMGVMNHVVRQAKKRLRAPSTIYLMRCCLRDGVLTP